MLECQQCFSIAIHENKAICPTCGSFYPSMEATSSGHSFPQENIAPHPTPVNHESTGEDATCNYTTNIDAMPPFWKEHLDTIISFFQNHSDGMSIVHISGPTEAGKSTFLHAALTRGDWGDAVVQWRPSTGDFLTPLGPVTEWIADRLGVRAGDEYSTVQEKIRLFFTTDSVQNDSNKNTYCSSDARLVEFLLSCSEACSDINGMKEKSLQDNIFGVLVRVLSKMSKTLSCPLVLVVEDADKRDDVTRCFLQHLFEIHSSIDRVLVIVSTSGDDSFQMPSEVDSCKIHLSPLGEKDNEYLETWQPDVDSLSVESFQVLQVCSMLGVSFDMSWIRMAGIGLTDRRNQVDLLLTQGFLRLERGHSKTYLAFNTSTIQKSIYETVPEQKRRKYHQLIARHIESEYPIRPWFHSARLAWHYFEAKNVRRSVYYIVRISENLEQYGRVEDALLVLKRAVQLLQKEDFSYRSSPILLTHLLTRSGYLLRRTGRVDESKEMLSNAIELSRKLKNDYLQLESKVELAVSAVWENASDEALQTLEEVQAKAERLENADAELIALSAFGIVNFQRGDYTKALGSFKRQIKLSRKMDSVQSEADALNNAGLVCWRSAKYRQALKMFEQAVPLRRRGGDLFGLCTTFLNIGILREQYGEITDAFSNYRAALDLAEQLHFTIGKAACKVNASNLFLRIGQKDMALSLAEQALEHARVCNDHERESLAEENIAIALLAAGEEEQAKEHAGRSLRLAQRHDLKERAISAQLAVLEVNLTQCNDEYSLDALFDAPELGAELGEIENGPNTTIASVEEAVAELSIDDYLPRVYRCQALIHLADHPENAEESLRILDLAIDKSREIENFFEEFESLKTLRKIPQTAGTSDTHAVLEARLTEMHLILSKNSVDSSVLLW